jgi:hypothetical protein
VIYVWLTPRWAWQPFAARAGIYRKAAKRSLRRTLCQCRMTILVFAQHVWHQGTLLRRLGGSVASTRGCGRCPALDVRPSLGRLRAELLAGSCLFLLKFCCWLFDSLGVVGLIAVLFFAFESAWLLPLSILVVDVVCALCVIQNFGVCVCVCCLLANSHGGCLYQLWWWMRYV